MYTPGAFKKKAEGQDISQQKPLFLLDEKKPENILTTPLPSPSLVPLIGECKAENTLTSPLNKVTPLPSPSLKPLLGEYKPGAFKKTIQEIEEEKRLVEAKLIPSPKLIPLPILFPALSDNLVVPQLETKNNFKRLFSQAKDEEQKKITKDEEINPVKYLRHHVYENRKKYISFMEEEGERLEDIYKLMLNYNQKFLDKLGYNKKDFLKFAQFVHLLVNT